MNDDIIIEYEYLNAEYGNITIEELKSLTPWERSTYKRIQNNERKHNCAV